MSGDGAVHQGQGGHRGHGDASTEQADGGLVLDDVSVRYGPTTVIDRLSVTVDRGEVLAVLGPSGSGKSTLLRAVAGLEPLDGGSITLAGRDLGRVPTHQRGLGLMFQDHGLFTHLDVVGNIGYGLEVAGMAAPDRRRRVDELVALVGLEGLERRRVDQLSGGEAQRVALARALAPEPGLLMLDEPLGSLDRSLREQLTGDLRRLLSELGQTALHVTHDQSEAFAVADRVAVLDGGALVAVGRPAELWSDPGSTFVAGFLGHPNRWTATIGDGGEVRVDQWTIGRVEAGHPLREAGSGPVEVLVPVTAISLAGVDSLPAPDGGIDAVVERVVFDQGRHRVTARLDGPSRGSDAGDGPGTVRAELDHLGPVEVGQRCQIVVDLAAVRTLDRF